MERRGYLQIPGPTNIPPRILKALASQPIDHRGEEFEKLVGKSLEGLKEIYRTKNDILIFPSSGSGILESVIVNLFSEGDTIVVGSLGVFSERMGLIAESHGLKVIRVTKVWGESVKPVDIEEILKEDKHFLIKAVCVPQNETATGVVNDIESISKVIKDLKHPALLIVDIVSSLGCYPFENDEWNVDLAIGASQKGLMLPSGIGMVSVSKKAWEAVEKSTLSKWYWDYKAAKAKLDHLRFTYTPPTSLMLGLVESIDMFREEGLENIWKRHALMADAVRKAAEAMGLKLLAEKGYESNTVTTIMLPEDINYNKFSELVESKYGVVLGGGLERLEGKMFRVGHMGTIDKLDIYAIMGAIEMSLYEMGYKVELGTAAKAVSQVFLA